MEMRKLMTIVESASKQSLNEGWVMGKEGFIEDWNGYEIEYQPYTYRSDNPGMTFGIKSDSEQCYADFYAYETDERPVLSDEELAAVAKQVVIDIKNKIHPMLMPRARMTSYERKGGTSGRVFYTLITSYD